MKSKTLTLIIILVFLVGCSDDSTAPAQNKSSVTSVQGELIPRSMQEKANYYLISNEPDGEYIKTLHSRVSSSIHGYSVTRIDCLNNRYQDLGYGEGQKSNIKMYDNVRWTEVILGSSKSDLVVFACSRTKP